jgi:hypothetical protein
MRVCQCRAKPGRAAGSATRMIHVVLQAAIAAKVRRQRACLAPWVPAARSTAMVCGVSRPWVGMAAAVCVVWDGGGAE